METGEGNVMISMLTLTTNIPGISEPPAAVLIVNIPLLADEVPPGWTVSLVDNPGFGEAKEHVQLADASLVTSSAHIYLIQTENIGVTEAAHFFKELTQKYKNSYSYVHICMLKLQINEPQQQA